jgi:hypothetical protein
MKHVHAIALCLVTASGMTMTLQAQRGGGASPPAQQNDAPEPQAPVPPGRTAPDAEAPRPAQPVRPRSSGAAQPTVSTPAPLSPGSIGPTSDGLLFTTQGPFPALPSPSPVVGTTNANAASPSPASSITGPDPSSSTSRTRSCASGESNGASRTVTPPPASSSPPSGVSTAQFPRAGVSADAFVRPGVSAAQLATLVPGTPNASCAPSRDVILYPAPVNRPRPIQPAGQEP